MISVISVTKKGDCLAYLIKENIDCNVINSTFFKGSNLEDITKECFKESKYIIFISSTGIAVRAISKFIKDKKVDPGVIVVDVCNNFTISLVSGHLGGANYMTQKISEILNNTPVITTATDNLKIKAPDILAKENNLIIDDFNMAKRIASRLVNNKKVYFFDDRNILKVPDGYLNTTKIKENTVVITDEVISDKNILILLRKDIILGIGCKKGTSFQKLKDFVFKELKLRNIDLRSVKSIGSIDIKKDEECIKLLAKELKVDLHFFEKEEIEKVQDEFIGSEFVRKITGVKAVSGPSVKLLNGEILEEKLIFEGITLSIGRLRSESL